MPLMPLPIMGCRFVTGTVLLEDTSLSEVAFGIVGLLTTPILEEEPRTTEGRVGGLSRPVAVLVVMVGPVRDLSDPPIFEAVVEVIRLGAAEVVEEAFFFSGTFSVVGLGALGASLSVSGPLGTSEGGKSVVGDSESNPGEGKGTEVGDAIDSDMRDFIDGPYKLENHFLT